MQGTGQLRKDSGNETKVVMIDEEGLEEKLYESLKKYELPDYFLYTGSGGARNWLNLDESKTFPIARKLKNLLEENLISIVKFIPTGMNFVSIGVGSGEKERIILNEMIKKNEEEAKNKSEEEVFGSGKKRQLHYYPIDINSRMVDIALEKVQDLPVEKKGIVGFIEDMPLLKKHWHLPVLFCIMGNTFCNYEPDFILKLVGENLESGDLFMFDAHIFPAIDGSDDAKSMRNKVLATYSSRENALFNVYPLLHYGMAPEDFDFELLLSRIESGTEGSLYRTRKTLQILNNTEIRVGPGTVKFKEGDVIKMGFTYKYTFEQICAFLNKEGFEILRKFLSEDRTNVIILAKKRTS
ncbi:MAG: L-histidine N(alpha)-methyltransferase [Methanosarcinaceae archaeon]